MGYSLWGRKELDTTEAMNSRYIFKNLTRTLASIIFKRS